MLGNDEERANKVGAFLAGCVMFTIFMCYTIYYITKS